MILRSPRPVVLPLPPPLRKRVTSGSSFLGSGNGSSTNPTTTWSRASNPAGIQVKVDLLNDKVTTTLSGQSKIGTLSLMIKTASGQSKTLSTHSSAQTGNSFSDSLQRMSLTAGQYGSVVATWDDVSVTVPVGFYVIGNTRFSQYNNPYDSQCSANPQPAWIVYKTDFPTGTCYYKSVSLGAAFISQTNINGTGVSSTNGILKAYSAGARSVCGPAPRGNGQNTFFAVDSGGATISKIKGTCNSVLSDGTGLSNPLLNNNPPAGSLATFPGSNNPPFACSDQVLMIDQNDNHDLRSLQDACPACNGGFGSPAWGNTTAHIDTFNSSQTCNPKALGDYGNRVAIRLR